MKIAAFNPVAYNIKQQNKNIAFCADRENGYFQEGNDDKYKSYNYRTDKNHSSYKIRLEEELERLKAERDEETGSNPLVWPFIVASFMAVFALSEKNNSSKEIPVDEFKQNVSAVVDSMDIDKSDSISFEEAQNFSKSKNY